MAIVRYTTTQLKKMKSKTDITRVHAMTDADIDYSDAPDVADMVANGKARIVGRPKKAVTKKHQNLRLDADIIDGFKRGGRGWQTRINDALRAHLRSIGVL